IFSTTADGTAPQAFMQGEAVGEIRQVTLRRSKSNEGLGFSIRGGSEHGVGIYVSLVEPGSFAENEGLRVGDQIVTVNGMLFDRVSHLEAVKVQTCGVRHSSRILTTETERQRVMWGTS
uniref:PDZ domain-containing protein n=1 Tax=Salmo trutta TaxID=8032 RepID=A0A673ZQ47_SALTR